ncbi:MAG: hypothetical protein GX939_01510 [Clostridiaceae bacterium]|jgi:hypothetical protein|nr:hypothetical protein [Clostridiaceae bacterium]
MNKTDRKTKSVVGIALIYVIIFGVLNLLIFTIFKTRTNVFWLSYAFMALAFVVQIVSMFLSFKKADVETAFFGIPLASFSVFYLGAAIVVGALFMIFQAASFTLALVIQTLVLATFLVIAIISLLARDTVQQVIEDQKKDVASHKSVLVDIEMMSEAVADPELRKALYRLSETVKYSDPITNEAVAGIEQRIKHKVKELGFCIEDNQIADAMHTCGELEQMYLERNKRLAISK